MKKYLLLAAALFVGTICLTSCGDDDDDKGPNFEQLFQQLKNGEIKPTATFTEESNKMTLSKEYPGAYTEKYVYTFNDKGLCYSGIAYYDFKYKELADMFWEHVMNTLSDKDKAMYKRTGDTSFTYQPEVSALGKDFYRALLQGLADSITPPTLDQLIEGYTSGKRRPSTTFNENANPMTLVIDFTGWYTYTQQANFGSDLTCNQYTEITKYATKELADVDWAEAKDDPAFSRKDDFTLVYTGSNKLKGMSRKQVTILFQDDKNRADAGNWYKHN